MKVIYYYWGELPSKLALEQFEAVGIEYKSVSPTRNLYDHDESFIEAMRHYIIEEKDCDAVFSFNYFPDLSRVAMECGIKYISWVYDSPHLTLESLTLTNTCNYVFVFDYALFRRYESRGINTVHYLPLPARIINFDDEIAYKHEITFLGNLYDGEQDQYGKIDSLPEYISGYLEAVIQTQMMVYGADIIDELVNDVTYSEIAKYVNTELGTDYRKCGLDIFKNILRRRVTMNERTMVLKRLGKRVDLYCGCDHPELPVTNKGFADYYSEMPEIFRTSKINLNITLRSIQTGIPLRVMDILGAGGFCITNYQPEIEEYFENGKDIVWYTDIDDLVTKCDYYLEHENERIEIARNGQMKVKELFSYKKQLNAIRECVMNN